MKPRMQPRETEKHILNMLSIYENTKHLILRPLERAIRNEILLDEDTEILADSLIKFSIITHDIGKFARGYYDEATPRRVQHRLHHNALSAYYAYYLFPAVAPLSEVKDFDYLRRIPAIVAYYHHEFFLNRYGLTETLDRDVFREYARIPEENIGIILGLFERAGLSVVDEAAVREQLSMPNPSLYDEVIENRVISAELRHIHIATIVLGYLSYVDTYEAKKTRGGSGTSLFDEMNLNSVVKHVFDVFSPL